MIDNILTFVLCAIWIYSALRTIIIINLGLKIIEDKIDMMYFMITLSPLIVLIVKIFMR